MQEAPPWFRQLEQLLCINYVVSRGKCSNCKKQVQIRISCACLILWLNLIDRKYVNIYVSFQKDHITICFWFLHLHQMSWTEFCCFVVYLLVYLKKGGRFKFENDIGWLLSLKQGTPLHMRSAPSRAQPHLLLHCTRGFRSLYLLQLRLERVIGLSLKN